MTQYMMMLYGPTDPTLVDEAGTDINRWIEYDAMLKAAGVHVADNRLHDPSTATTVRVRNNETVISDGPFAETKEWLTGYYLVDAPDLDKVLELAAKVPFAHFGSIEIRPVMTNALPPDQG